MFRCWTDIHPASPLSSGLLTISVSPPSPELPRIQPQQARTRAISTPQRPRLQTDLPPRPQSRNATPMGSTQPHFPSFSLIGALEFHDVVASLRHQAASSSLSIFESPVTPFAGGHYHRHSVSRQRTPRTSLSSRDEDPLDQLALSVVSQQDDRLRPYHSAPPRTTNLTEEPEEFDDDSSHSHLAPIGYFNATHERYVDDPHSPSSTHPSNSRTPATSTISDDDTESQDYVPPTRWQRILSVLENITQTLLPSLHHFRNQSILAQIASIFAAPAVMFLTLTLPVVVTRYESATAAREKMFNGDGRLVDFEEEGEERVLIAEEEVLEDMHEMSFNKWLTSVQCAIAPVFCAAVLFSSCFTFTLVNPTISNMHTYM
jgi:solute carrier family 24 (sodium/potassium/calcium exchanger), member 6